MRRGPQDDAQWLRTALRELIALSTVPATWVGRDPPAIAAELADVMIHSLRFDFAFVRLRDSLGGAAVEAVKGDASRAFLEWLQHYLAADGRKSRREIIRGVGNSAHPLPCILIPIGLDAESGLVVAACHRSDFPSEIDWLLLSVAANHAATAFRTARLVDAHRRAEEALRESERRLRKARDELETKVAERTAELQRSEAYLAEAQKLSHAGSFGWDISSGRLYWSEETFRIFECDRTDQPTLELTLQRIHPDDRARVQQIIDRARGNMEDLDFEHQLMMPGGKIKNIHIVGHPIFGESGDFVEFVGAVIDVTGLRRAEKEREALAHANRMETMGHLSASIAHEVNQPLSGIVTSAETSQLWLKKEPPNVADTLRALARIARDARRASDIVGRIRALTKKARLQQDRVDINKAILEVIALTHGETVKNGVAVRKRLADDLPIVHGDRVQLQQVMLNLIMNAVEAMSGLNDRPRELLIDTSKIEADDVLVTVRDSGFGLDSANLERIFEAFYTTKGDGLGMGLSICRSIVEAHGGKLWAKTRKPHGAAFQFSLPSRTDDAAPGGASIVFETS